MVSVALPAATIDLNCSAAFGMLGQVIRDWEPGRFGRDEDVQGGLNARVVVERCECEPK